jgi:hypothetical protein
MIRVACAPEPGTFSTKVRDPGLRAIAEMVGETPPRSHGRRFAKIARLRQEIPADKQYLRQKSWQLENENRAFGTKL